MRTLSVGMICLCLFLALFGLMALIPATNIPAMAVIQAIAALAASVLLLIGK